MQSRRVAPAAPPQQNGVPKVHQSRNDVHTQQPPRQVGSKTAGLRPFTDPVARVSLVQERVIKLEKALAAMEGIEGSEIGLASTSS